MTIVVFGSINMDLVVRTPRLPSAGETLTGETFFTAPGGKGANQAVACARLGAPTQMIGRVGSDVFGGALREGLNDNRVDITNVATDDQQPSGVALITVEAGGENTIIVVPGANGAVGDADLERLRTGLRGARLLLLQLEVPLPAVIAAARAAHEQGIRVMLDPAPALPLPPELYGLVDILTPNATEAEMLVGFPINGEAAARRGGKVLLERGVGTAVIKLGEKGVYWVESNGLDGFMGAFPVKVVDTVAAGDAFNSGLATALNEDVPFTEAIKWGLAAGGLAVTKQGAQPSLPDREALLALLAQHTQ